MPTDCPGGYTCKMMMCTPQSAVNAPCTLDTDCLTGRCNASFCSVVTGPPNWLKVATLTGGRYFMAAFPLADGRVVLAGGRAGSPTATTNRVDIYNIKTNTFSTGNVLPTAREALAGAPDQAGINGYAIGGAGTGSGDKTVTLFNNSAWFASTVMLTQRAQGGCALATNGKIYCSGGYDAAGTVQTNDEFTPNSGWVNKASMPTSRYALALSAGPDGKVYAIGGFDINDTPFATVEAYNPNTNAWTTAAPLPQSRGNLGAALGADGRIYAVAGIDTAQMARVDAYTPATNRWETVDALRQGVRSSHAAVRGADGRIYAFGNSTTADWPTEVYGPNPALSTSTGTVGSPVTVSGNNFGPSARVAVSFNAVAVANGTTDASGGLTAPIIFTVPNVGSGTYKVTVTDNRSAFPVSFDFVVP
jgi:hypothetical protein